MSLYFLAHVFSDFICQSQDDVDERMTNNLAGNLRHIRKVMLVFVLFSALYVALVQAWDSTILVPIVLFVLINGITHLIIDLLKTALSNKTTRHAFWIFLLDQLLHFAVIAVLYRWLLDAYVITLIPAYTIRLLFFLSLATFVSAVFIKHILEYFDLRTKNAGAYAKPSGTDDASLENEDSEQFKTTEDPNTVKHGWWIGIIERTIMFLALVFNFLGLLTVVIAFKTVSRYPEFKNNSDYYIIGNLLSILFVLVFYGLFDALT